MSTTLTFTQDQLQTILDALADAPFKKAAPVVNAIQVQLRVAALKEKAEADAKTEVKADEPKAEKSKAN